LPLGKLQESLSVSLGLGGVTSGNRLGLGHHLLSLGGQGFDARRYLTFQDRREVSGLATPTPGHPPGGFLKILPGLGKASG